MNLLSYIFLTLLIFFTINFIYSCIIIFYRIFLIMKYSKIKEFPNLKNLDFSKVNKERRKFLDTIRNIDLELIEYTNLMNDYLNISDKIIDEKHKNSIQKEVNAAFAVAQNMKMLLFLMLHYAKRSNLIWSLEIILYRNYDNLISKKYKAFVTTANKFHEIFLDFQKKVNYEKKILEV